MSWKWQPPMTLVMLRLADRFLRLPSGDELKGSDNDSMRKPNSRHAENDSDRGFPTLWPAVRRNLACGQGCRISPAHYGAKGAFWLQPVRRLLPGQLSAACRLLVEARAGVESAESGLHRRNRGRPAPAHGNRHLTG